MYCDWLNNMGKNVDIIDRLVEGLKRLYMLSPLSWCNFTMGRPGGSIIIQLLICIVIIYISTGLGISCYTKRRFIQ